MYTCNQIIIYKDDILHVCFNEEWLQLSYIITIVIPLFINKYHQLRNQIEMHRQRTGIVILLLSYCKRQFDMSYICNVIEIIYRGFPK